MLHGPEIIELKNSIVWILSTSFWFIGLHSSVFCPLHFWFDCWFFSRILWIADEFLPSTSIGFAAPCLLTFFETQLMFLIGYRWCLLVINWFSQISTTERTLSWYCHHHLIRLYPYLLHYLIHVFCCLRASEQVVTIERCRLYCRSLADTFLGWRSCTTWYLHKSNLTPSEIFLHFFKPTTFSNS